MAIVVRTGKDVDLFAPFSQEFFAQFLKSLAQKDALIELRQRSYELATKTAAPSNRDEDFKYVNFRTLNFDGIRPTLLDSASNQNGKPATLMLSGTQRFEAVPEYYRLEGTEKATTGDVAFTSFAESAAIVEAALKMLDAEFPARKFAYLAHAFLSQGTFYRIGKNLTETSTRHIYTRVTEAKALTSHATLIVVDENSRGELVWDVDGDETASGLLNGTLDIVLRRGAKLNVMLNQHHSNSLDTVMTARCYLDQGAELEMATMNSGGRVNQMEIDLAFAGKGAQAQVSGMYLGRNEENFNLLTHQDHRIGNTKSDLFYIGTLSGKSRSNYLGKITIAPSAQRSDAYQKNRNLVLDKGVAVNSSPKLEIAANDVRCTHGATTARVSDLEMFYLMSRGIDKAGAKVLLAEGFVEQMAARLKAPLLQQAFANRLAALLSHWHED